MRFIVFVCILLLTACTTNGHYNRSILDWRGQNVKRLVAAWGLPDETVKGAHGNTIYIYNTIGYTNTRPSPPAIGINTRAGGVPVMVMSNSLPNQASTTFCTIWFEIDKRNVIISTRHLGPNCQNNN